MPLRWAIRDMAGLKGTRYGCGVAQCGVCTVHLDSEAVRSCVTRGSRAEGNKIVTTEGGQRITPPLQKSWQEIDVPQCGYCQSGQIMSAAVTRTTEEQSFNLRPELIKFTFVRAC